jgi:hypothetical protein
LEVLVQHKMVLLLYCRKCRKHWGAFAVLASLLNCVLYVMEKASTNPSCVLLVYRYCHRTINAVRGHRLQSLVEYGRYTVVLYSDLLSYRTSGGYMERQAAAEIITVHSHKSQQLSIVQNMIQQKLKSEDGVERFCKRLSRVCKRYLSKPHHGESVF